MATQTTTNQLNPNASQGVGVRHKETPTPPGGGGYLNNCSDLKPQSANFEKSPPPFDLFFLTEGSRYIDEVTAPPVASQARSIPTPLRDIGLAPVWQRVAAVMGTQTFMELWAILHEYAPRDGERVRVDLPSPEALNKVRRNTFIRFCASKGMSTALIIKACKKKGYRDVSERTVQRAMSL